MQPFWLCFMMSDALLTPCLAPCHLCQGAMLAAADIDVYPHNTCRWVMSYAVCWREVSVSTHSRTEASRSLQPSLHCHRCAFSAYVVHHVCARARAVCCATCVCCAAHLVRCVHALPPVCVCTVCCGWGCQCVLCMRSILWMLSMIHTSSVSWVHASQHLLGR